MARSASQGAYAIDGRRRRMYPRSSDLRYNSPRADSVFEAFKSLTNPHPKENVFDKAATDSFANDIHYSGAHISLAPPGKLDLTFKDTRNRPLPKNLQSLNVFEQPLRSLDRTAMSRPQFYDEAARMPPQPIPAQTQRQEEELVETLEKALAEGQLEQPLWDQYAKRALELVITMQLDKVLRLLKAFVLASYRGREIYTRIGNELAKEVKTGSSARLCQAAYWLARAGLRDATLMSLIGNECVLRLTDDFELDMYIEMLNVHGKLEVRNPRLINCILRELGPRVGDFGKDQCCALAPLSVMTVLTDAVRIPFLSRCAELGLGLPVHMTKPAVLRHFRLLEDCLRLDYHPTMLPNVVQLWLANLKSEADFHDVITPSPLSPIETDMLRLLQEDMDVDVTPVLQDGVFTLHLVMGKTIIEVLDSFADYYVTPAMGGQKLLRAETKFRHRMLWRHGWRILTLDEEDWSRLNDDLYKKDLLEDMLRNGPRRTTGRLTTSMIGS